MWPDRQSQSLDTEGSETEAERPQKLSPRSWLGGRLPGSPGNNKNEDQKCISYLLTTYLQCLLWAKFDEWCAPGEETHVVSTNVIDGDDYHSCVKIDKKYVQFWFGKKTIKSI